MSALASEGTHKGLGKANRRSVLSEVILNGPISRTEIASRTGLTNASVSRISKGLIAAGLILEGEVLPSPKRAGRRFIGLQVNPGGGGVLGIGINAFQQSVTLADLANRRLHREELKLGSLADPHHVLSRVAEAAQAIVARAEMPADRIFGGSLAITGAVDPLAGSLREAPALGWQSFPVGDFLSTRIGLPICVESLPNAMNLAENRFGISRDARNVVLFNASLGIGCSLLMDGRLIRGRDFSTGLIGDLRLWISDRQGSPTVDEAAGGRSVLTELGDGETTAIGAQTSAERLIRAMSRASAGDKSARRALANAGRRLGEIAHLVGGIVQPDAIVLSGPLARSTDFIAAAQNALTNSLGRTPEFGALRVSAMTSQGAARWLAINEFLINRDIDLARLQRREAA